MSFRKSDLFVRFRAFYIKEFTRRKSHKHNQIIHNNKQIEYQQYIIILLRIFIFPKGSLPLQQENINTNNMENKNIKRINETLKEIAEAQQDTVKPD